MHLSLNRISVQYWEHNLGIALAENMKTNSDRLLKSKQVSQVVEDDDSGEEIILPKRRRMTTNETVGFVAPSSDEER